ncbi:MAG: cupin domain-containing protein [Planctomycetes bacterium]|nr:cupin domain-containing protein [Planctomycetota bacterium]
MGPGITRETGGHADDKDHVMVQPDKIKWGPAPAALPAGAQMAVLAGDPSKKGMPFVIRAKLPDGYKVPAHFHPSDENVTVLKGTFMIGRGDKFAADKMEAMPAGAFMRMPKDMRHFAAAKGETIIQVHGVGPFDITYIDPTDDPRSKGK